MGDNVFNFVLLISGTIFLRYEVSIKIFRVLSVMRIIRYEFSHTVSKRSGKNSSGQFFDTGGLAASE